MADVSVQRLVVEDVRMPKRSQTTVEGKLRDASLRPNLSLRALAEKIAAIKAEGQAGGCISGSREGLKGRIAVSERFQ